MFPQATRVSVLTGRFCQHWAFLSAKKFLSAMAIFFSRMCISMREACFYEHDVFISNWQGCSPQCYRMNDLANGIEHLESRPSQLAFSHTITVMWRRLPGMQEKHPVSKMRHNRNTSETSLCCKKQCELIGSS